MDLLNQHLYGYASIRTGHTKKELINNFPNTKLYSDYLDIVFFLKSNFFYIPDEELTPDCSLIEQNMVFDPEAILQVDVMTSTRDGMYYKLDHIIEQAKTESIPFNTVITIVSLNSFGNCDNIKKYYKIFQKEKIGVLLIDHTRDSGLSEFSTCDFTFQRRPLPEYNRALDLVARLEDGDIPDNRGRISGEYTNAFRVAFWLYELYMIPENIAVAMSGYSKNGFHLKASNYEQTAKYKFELETFDEKFSISKLVKRNRPVPENFEKLIHMYEKKGNLELACILCKIPMIFPIDYERLLLKYKGGKKELFQCLKHYEIRLLDHFEEWVDAGNSPTEFYKECNMEQYLSDTYS